MDNSYIQEQHNRITNALCRFEAGSTNSMWAIIQGLYLIDSKKTSFDKGIPYTKIFLKDIDEANECEYYIAFTTKNAGLINGRIISRPQMFNLISIVKTELYKSYSKYISENYNSIGINFTASNNFLGGKL